MLNSEERGEPGNRRGIRQLCPEPRSAVDAELGSAADLMDSGIDWEAARPEDEGCGSRRLPRLGEREPAAGLSSNTAASLPSSGSLSAPIRPDPADLPFKLLGMEPVSTSSKEKAGGVWQR